MGANETRPAGDEQCLFHGAKIVILFLQGLE
jgi:hypothetical protein